MAIVQFDGIVGFAQGADGSSAIDTVAFLHIFQYAFVGCLLAFGFELVVASLCTHFGAGSNENLEFGIGEYRGAYITPVHHDALFLAHLLLQGYHRFSYKAYCGNEAHT